MSHIIEKDEFVKQLLSHVNYICNTDLQNCQIEYSTQWLKSLSQFTSLPILDD